MTRPAFTPSALLTTGLIWLAWAPAAAAAPITATAYYSLTADEGLAAPPAGDIDAPQVVALVSPAGGVVPPTAADGSQGSPLTILPDSHGFDRDQLVVALKDAASDSGAPEQYLGLIFFGKGLEAGGVLNFALSIDGALANDPPKLASSTPGVRIAALPAPDVDPGNPPGSGGDSGGPNVPEPVGFLLWSAAAVAIATRGRARVRAAAGR
ncbi:hypothetical protein [Paludisphaera sp.]|uniref:hypothetical protein n=1 Tax=Paludisphaera sp. TaxID=2017432 RepID=UPI00301C7C29